MLFFPQIRYKIGLKAAHLKLIHYQGHHPDNAYLVCLLLLFRHLQHQFQYRLIIFPR